MDVRPAASHPFGYVVVLLGVAVFVVSCFLPYVGGSFLGPGASISLYRIALFPEGADGQIGGVLYLFAGAATVGVISLLGLARARTAYAGLGVAVVGTIVVWVQSRSREREPTPITA